MEVAGYWNIDDPAVHQGLAAHCGESGRLLRGYRWALATAPSTLDDSDTVIPILDGHGQMCGVVVGHLKPSAAQRLPPSIDASALTAEPGSGGAVTELVWGYGGRLLVIANSHGPTLPQHVLGGEISNPSG
jgi:hypothetical protein